MHMLGLIYSQIPSLHVKQVQSWVFTKLTVMLFVASTLRSFIASFLTTTEDGSDLKKKKTEPKTKPIF